MFNALSAPQLPRPHLRALGAYWHGLARAILMGLRVMAQSRWMPWIVPQLKSTEVPQPTRSGEQEL